MRHTCVRLLAAVPIVALIAALPFVNRVEPVMFGLPLLLSWIVAWVGATPLFLAAAYFLSRDEQAGVRPGARDAGPRGSGR